MRRLVVLLALLVSCRGNQSATGAGKGASYREPKSALTLEEIKGLKDLLLNRQYEALDARLRALDEAFDRDRSKEPAVALAYSRFHASDPSLVRYLDEWNERLPNSYAARVARGLYYHRQGWLGRDFRFIHKTLDEQLAKMNENFDRAESDLTKAISMNATAFPAYSSLIGMAMAQGDRDAMRRWLEQAVDVNPGNSFAREAYVFGLTPRWGGSFEDMEEFARDTQRFSNHNPALTTLLGQVDAQKGELALQDGDAKAALEFFDRALSHGEHWGFLKARATALYELGRYDESLRESDRVLQVAPVSLIALENRSRALYALGRVQEAMEAVKLALALDPRNPDALELQAWMRSKQGQHEEALQDYEDALKVRPYGLSLWVAKGQLLLLELKDERQAEKSLQRALALDDEKAQAWYYLGLLYSKRKDQRAQRYLRRSLELERGSVLYADLAYRYSEGSFVDKNQQLALEFTRQAAQRGDASSRSRLGYQYLNGEGVSRDYATAYHWLSLAATGGDPGAMCNLGLLYDMGWGISQDHAQAAKWYWRSAVAGYTHARFNLGVAYYDGRGVGRDLLKAYFLLAVAAEHGDSDAIKTVSELVRDLGPAQLAEAKRRLAKGETGLEEQSR